MLCGVDVLIDTKLRAFTLETNVDPEFGIDRIRTATPASLLTRFSRLSPPCRPLHAFQAKMAKEGDF